MARVERMAGLRGRLGRPSRSRLRRVLRVVGWNMLILLAGLALLAGGAEAYLRLTVPFRENVLPVRLEPGVGVLYQPHAEARYTNGRDFWQVSRANSLGFLDREPPGAERAAASCHVTLIGDSFVEAREAPIADKAQVVLEELAAREAPELDVTTSAFGRSGTGQISQLAFYDAHARRLSPDVVVLVAVDNDFRNHSLPIMAAHRGFHPDYPPHLSARRGPGGEMEFVPPAADMDELLANRLPALAEPGSFPGASVKRRLREWSAFAAWAWTALDDDGRSLERQRLAWAELIRRDPRYTTLMRGWSQSTWADFAPWVAEDPLPVVREAMEVMRFALEQFRERAERDGAALVILASHTLGGEGDPRLGLLRELAGGIPIISQYDHVLAGGGEIDDLHWAHNRHWNATGHRRAAEAILEWLKRNPDVCG